MATQAEAEVVIRVAKSEDSTVCGKICYEAFATLSAKHGFPPDFPGPEVSTSVMTSLFSTPGFYCVVAESGGRIVGSNCLDERAMIAGIAPITVDPGPQNVGVGRRLMQAVMERARERCPAGMRLVQARITTGRFRCTGIWDLMCGSRFVRARADERAGDSRLHGAAR